MAKPKLFSDDVLLALLGRGASTAEIAAELGMKPKTIRSRVRNLRLAGLAVPGYPPAGGAAKKTNQGKLIKMIEEAIPAGGRFADAFEYRGGHGSPGRERWRRADRAARGESLAFQTAEPLPELVQDTKMFPGSIVVTESRNIFRAVLAGRERKQDPKGLGRTPRDAIERLLGEVFDGKPRGLVEVADGRRTLRERGTLPTVELVEFQQTADRVIDGERQHVFALSLATNQQLARHDAEEIFVLGVQAWRKRHGRTGRLYSLE